MPAAKGGKPPAKKPSTRKASRSRAKKKPVGWLVAVFGPFGSRALVEVPASVAQEMVADEELEPTPSFLVDAVAAELDELAERAPQLAGSALVALARALAYEIASPHNSATSKAANSKELRETLATLRTLAPPAEEEDEVERARKRRADRLAGTPAAGATSPS